MPVIREYNAPGGDVGRLRTSADPGREEDLASRGFKIFGQALQTIGSTINQVQQQRDTATLQKRTAEARAQLTTRLQQASQSGEILDEGFENKFTDEMSATTERIQSSMISGVGRSAAGVHSAQLSASMLQQVSERRAVAVGEESKRSYIDAMNLNANTLQSDPTQHHSVLESSLIALRATDGPFSGLSHKDRAVLEEDTRQTLAVSAITGLANVNAKSAHDQLKAGVWDTEITPQQKIQLSHYAERKQSERDGEAALSAVMRIDDLAQNGALTDKAILQARTDGVLKTNAQALSFRHKSQERAKQIERERTLQRGIELGDRAALAQVGFTNKEMETGFGLYAGRQMETAQDDPSRIAATNRIVTKGRELGLMAPQMETMLNYATPARPKNFDTASKWYSSLNAVDPVYAAQHVKPEQAALFHVYQTARLGGASDQVAIDTVRQAGDQDKMRKFRAELPASTLSNIESSVSRSFPASLFSEDATNAGWARNQIAEMTKLRIAFGDSTVEDASNWAASQFKARHVEVGGRWLPRKGAVSPDLPMALSTYLAKAPEGLKANGYSVDDIDPAGYDLRTDRQTQIDGSYQLYQKSSGLPVPGRRVTADQALKAYQMTQDEEAKTALPFQGKVNKTIRESLDGPFIP